jgi:hypothetical protein
MPVERKRRLQIVLAEIAPSHMVQLLLLEVVLLVLATLQEALLVVETEELMEALLLLLMLITILEVLWAAIQHLWLHAIGVL